MKSRDEAADLKPDNSCPICGRDRRLVVERGDGGAPARCVAYHPGYDVPGVRRFTRAGECWLTGLDGIRRREPERDMVRS